MHELGVLVHVLRTVREAAEEQHIEHVSKISLEVGEVCGVIPEYLEMQLPLAINGQVMFQDCKLDIHVIEATGRCLRCNNIYPLKVNEGICPKCHYDDFYTVEGTQLLIKEIEVS